MRLQLAGQRLAFEVLVDQWHIGGLDAVDDGVVRLGQRLEVLVG
jgi:hypothetical protein